MYIPSYFKKAKKPKKKLYYQLQAKYRKALRFAKYLVLQGISLQTAMDMAATKHRAQRRELKTLLSI